MEPEGSWVPILSQLDPVLNPISYVPKIQFNIILPSTPGSLQWALSLRFPHQIPVYASSLPHTHYMIRPSHSSRFYLPKIFGLQYRSLSSSLCIFLHSLLTSSLSAPNTPLNTLFSNILSLPSSLNVSNQVSHPYKTISRIIVLYILIFKS